MDSTEVGGKSRTAIEAEPAEPKEHRAKNDIRGIMRLVRKAFSSVSTAFAQVDGDSECGSSGGDMDRCSSGEIETTEEVRPAVRIPCPASDNVVDEGRPDKDKEDERA